MLGLTGLRIPKEDQLFVVCRSNGVAAMVSKFVSLRSGLLLAALVWAYLSTEVRLQPNDC